MKHYAFAAFGAACLLAASALPALAMDDATFLQTAIGINLEEIQMGQLAQSNSQNADVKSYGQLLVTDHTAANQKATALAQTASVQVPTLPSTDAQAAYDQMKGMNGADFDKMFLQHMVDGHTNAIAMFQDKSDDSSNDVSAFAKDSLPTLQKHLDTAKQLLASAGGAASGAMGTTGAAGGTTAAPAAGTNTVPAGNNGSTNNGGASSNDTNTTNGSAQ